MLALPRGAVRAGAWRGLALVGLSSLRHPDAAMRLGDGLVVNCDAPAEHGFGRVLELLCQPLPEV
ncbi:hypothetical protein [Allokutzneria oryzae]|uniref:Uncharacterized protein n=1 Tax=Allokutzneria oryzae TaxID=1378989 RepID=A0ABV6A8D4_9PSEU